MVAERAKVAACVARNDLFADLRGDDAAIGFLAERCKLVAHAAGSVIVREGDEGDTLIVLLTGTLRICKTTPAEEEYTVALLEGDRHPFIGELALFGDDRRSATAIADADTEVLTLTRAAFEEFAAAFPSHAVAVYRRLGTVLSQRLRGANDDVVTLFQALVQEIETQSLGHARKPSG